LKHWIQLNQSYNYAFQSMWESQRAGIDPGGGRVTTRWAITQRSESLQPHLLGQILIFFDYFWSIEFSLIRATIMSLKVCEIVDAHRSNTSEENWWFWCSNWFALAKFSKISMFNIFLKMQFDVFEFDIMFLNTADWKK